NPERDDGKRRPRHVGETGRRRYRNLGQLWPGFSDGRVGTFVVAGADPGGFSPQPAQPRAVPQGAETQAMLNLKVEKLQATVAQQQIASQRLIANGGGAEAI